MERTAIGNTTSDSEAMRMRFECLKLALAHLERNPYTLATLMGWATAFSNFVKDGGYCVSVDASTPKNDIEAILQHVEKKFLNTSILNLGINDPMTAYKQGVKDVIRFIKTI